MAMAGYSSYQAFISTCLSGISGDILDESFWFSFIGVSMGLHSIMPNCLGWDRLMERATRSRSISILRIDAVLARLSFAFWMAVFKFEARRSHQTCIWIMIRTQASWVYYIRKWEYKLLSNKGGTAVRRTCQRTKLWCSSITQS